MDPLPFPYTDLDQPAKFTGFLGTWWSDVYTNEDLQAWLLSGAQLYQQASQNFSELIDSISRHSCPVWHEILWKPLWLNRSDLGQTQANMPRYDGTYFYGLGGLQIITGKLPNGAGYWIQYYVPGIHYGVAVGSPTYNWTAPDKLVDVKVLSNRLTAAGPILIEGIDYIIDEGILKFDANPFDNPAFAQQTVIENGMPVDEQAVLWMYGSTWDNQNLDEQFGYVFGLDLPPQDNSRGFLNAVYDSMVQGNTIDPVNRLFADAMDVPIARTEGEVVEAVFIDELGLRIVTDQQVYTASFAANATVTVGQKLHAGQSLTDALKLFQLTRGQVPPTMDVPALALGVPYIGSGYFQELTFSNTTVPVSYFTDAMGYLQCRFAISGYPGDIEKFWETVDANGVAAGKTLAACLQPTFPPNRFIPGALPPNRLQQTINPLGFVLQNFFRANMTLVTVRVNAQGDMALGIDYAMRQLRRLLPPSTTILIIAALEVTDVPVTMTGTGVGAEIFTSTPTAVFTLTEDVKSSPNEVAQAKSLGGRCI